MRSGFLPVTLLELVGSELRSESMIYPHGGAIETWNGNAWWREFFSHSAEHEDCGLQSSRSPWVSGVLNVLTVINHLTCKRLHGGLAGLAVWAKDVRHLKLFKNLFVEQPLQSFAIIVITRPSKLPCPQLLSLGLFPGLLCHFTKESLH
jgi:hypothetical protein